VKVSLAKFEGALKMLIENQKGYGAKTEHQKVQSHTCDFVKVVRFPSVLFTDFLRI